jgi:cell division septation protein DedD
MSRSTRLVAGLRITMMAVAVVTCARPLDAQGGRSPVERIRALVAQADSASARRIADSLATSSSANDSARAEGYFWRGMLAASARERRLDLVRTAVDFPLLSVAGDALFRLAQMDLAAGDRANARRLLQRTVRDYGTSPTSSDAAFELGQMLLADGEAREGCAALDSAIQWTPPEQVEKRNRMSYVRRPCAQLATEPPRDSQPEPAGRAGTAGSATVLTQGRAATGGTRASSLTRLWSAQVGAFASKEDADRIATRLATRGYEARVTGDKPFRVRIGKFAKRADAAALVAKLKAEKTAAILVEAERP